MPYYLSIGVSYERFMSGTPKELEPYTQAQNMRDNRVDAYLWELGVYISHAISSCFDKKEKYPDKPLFQIDTDKVYMTQEEIDDIEIQKMIFAEKQWQKKFELKFGKNKS